MDQGLLTQEELRTAYSARTDPGEAARELIGQFGTVDAGGGAVLRLAGGRGRADRRALAERFPAVPVIGCTSAGEFTERGTATSGVSAVVLPRGVVRRAAGALARLDAGVDTGVAAAVADVEGQLQVSLRDADPGRYVGLVLIDGLHGSEERVNEVLGNLAPLLSFVGGSAGDDLKFAKTEVFCGGASSDHGAPARPRCRGAVHRRQDLQLRADRHVVHDHRGGRAQCARGRAGTAGCRPGAGPGRSRATVVTVKPAAVRSSRTAGSGLVR
jgi:hypothetical protein